MPRGSIQSLKRLVTLSVIAFFVASLSATGDQASAQPSTDESDSAGSVAARSLAAAKGKAKVKVSGPTFGKSAKISVENRKTGKVTKVKVKGTKSVNLRSGTYRAEASPVTKGQKSSVGTVKPTKFKIRSGGSTSLKVKYRKQGPAGTYSQITLGGAHTCGRNERGDVRCWGANRWLQIGTPNSRDAQDSPAAVPGLPRLSDISAGFRHTCGVTSGGKGHCWGSNAFGQLGGGSFISTGCDRSTGCPGEPSKPTNVNVGNKLVDISSGSEFSCAVDKAGAVVCWGRNNRGQLGDGSLQNSPGPVSTSISSGAINVASGDEFACALMADGGIKCWGANSYGQLGVGANSVQSTSPVDVLLPAPARTIATGFRHACAELVDDSMVCWGDNRVGQLGDGTKKSRAIPGVVSVSGAKDIAAGGRNTCAVQKTGKVSCWGANENGQLGQGNLKNKSGLVTVKKLSSVSNVSIGYAHVCAVRSNDTASCWGNNWSYQLGDETRDSNYRAVNVIG